MVAKGPLAATQASLIDMGWKAPTWNEWQAPDSSRWKLDFEDPWAVAELKDLFADYLERAQVAAISKQQAGQHSAGH